jgi:succinyl-CoA synthetase beta subunit
VRLYEHEAKRVFADAGIRTPKCYGVAGSAAAVRKMALRGPAMVKAQVLVGGRGKAGGIRKASSAQEAASLAEQLLGMSIGGYAVTSLLLEEPLEFSAECYLGVTVNPATSNSVMIASATGGMDIEQVARTRPEAVLRVELPDNPDQLPADIATRIGQFLADGLDRADLKAALADVATRLYGVYQNSDAKVAEINPLFITPSGPVAGDGKIVLDDNALYRQAELLGRLKIAAKRHEVAEPTARETAAAEAGFAYVDLLPENAQREPGKVYVGLVPGGAGYGIFSIDEVTNVSERYFDGRLVPVNFMDSGGGPTRQGVAEMFAILMDYPLVDVIVTSRFGGISSCDVFIRGLVDCLRGRSAQGQRIVPIYGRMVGTDLPAAAEFLDKARAETPEELSALSMIVGNRKIMADVIREGLADFLARGKESTR